MPALATNRRLSGSIPTSSMADIAFLLLIFFLVTTVFAKDHGLALVLPQATTEVPQRNILHLLVGPTGLVEARLGENPQSQIVSADQVGDLWRAAVAQNARLIAAVKVDPDAAYGRMIDVLDQLQGASAERVSVQIIPR